MTYIQKLTRKLTSAGALSFVIFFILGIFLVSPFLLLLGLDFMGFDVDYTFKSFMGAILVIIVLRVPTQKSNGK
jgi:uncharacterized membrane protein YeaQ/YmgE (transglycosylase-associated protein family)